MMYEELVKALRTCSELDSCFWLGDTCPYFNSELCDDKSGKAADAIEDLQKQLQKSEVDNINLTGWLAEEHAKHLWIPVTERLPNCNGCYLVWRPHFFGGEIGMPSICYFDGSNTWHDSYGVDFERILHPDDVTHWMPLPEPPESEEE